MKKEDKTVILIDYYDGGVENLGLSYYCLIVSFQFYIKLLINKNI